MKNVPGKFEEQPPEKPLAPLPGPRCFDLDSSETLLLNPYNGQVKNKSVRANKHQKKLWKQLDLNNHKNTHEMLNNKYTAHYKT